MSFNLDSSFHMDSAFTQVLFGEKRPVMETELNELQEIQDILRRELVHTLFSDGLIPPYNLSFRDGVLRILDTKAIINGEIIYISHLSVPLSEGNLAYIEVWREEIDFTHTIKRYGNEQGGAILENKLIDPRMGFETSRRIQTKYDLYALDTPYENPAHFRLGKVVNGQFVENPDIEAKLKLAPEGSSGGGSGTSIVVSNTAPSSLATGGLWYQVL